MPSEIWYYVLAVALHSAGHADEAMTVLKENLARHPNDRDTLLALVGLYRDAGNPADALHYAKLLAAINPQDRNLADLIEDLSRQAK